MDERNPSWQSTSPTSGGVQTPPLRGHESLSDETLGQAKRVGSSAFQKVTGIADSKKGDLADGLRAIARHLEKASGEEEIDGRVGSVASMAAGWVRNASDMIESRSADEMIESVQRELRTHPGLSIAGLFALGFLGARLLRE